MSYFENKNFHYNCIGLPKFNSTDPLAGTLGHKLKEDAREYLDSMKYSSECVELVGIEKEFAIKQAMKNLKNKENRIQIWRGRS